VPQSKSNATIKMRCLTSKTPNTSQQWRQRGAFLNSPSVTYIRLSYDFKCISLVTTSQFSTPMNHYMKYSHAENEKRACSLDSLLPIGRTCQRANIRTRNSHNVLCGIKMTRSGTRDRMDLRSAVCILLPPLLESVFTYICCSQL